VSAARDSGVQANARPTGYAAMALLLPLAAAWITGLAAHSRLPVHTWVGLTADSDVVHALHASASPEQGPAMVLLPPV
jgi:hypothetical protein